MNVPEESDSGIVPMNHSNKIEQSMAESEEGRPLIKENIHQSSTRPTQSGAHVSQGLAGVRKVARDHKEMKFTALLHHVTVDLLRDSFSSLKRKAAPGVDGMTWQEYEAALEGRLADLHSRLHRGAYRRIHREGSTSRKATDGNVRSGSPPWRTRSPSMQWSPSSTISMRRTSSASRMDFVQDAASIRRWMRCPMRS